MEDMRIRQGETLTLTIIEKDLTAESVTFTAKKTDDIPVISQTVSFVTEDDVRVAEFNIDTTAIPVDEDGYAYMYTINYSDGTVEKLPDSDECDSDDCELPVLIICEAIDVGVS